MLANNLRTIGIGHVVYNGRHYWAQAFGGAPQDAVETPAMDGAADVSVLVNPNMIKTGTPELDPTIDFTQTELNLNVNDTVTAPQATFNFWLKDTWPGPDSSFGKKPSGKITVPWKSDNESVVKVEGDQIKAVGGGEAQLTGTVMGETLNITVHVVAPLIYTPVPEKKATCTEDGMLTHFKGSDGKLYVENEQGDKVVTTAEKLTVKALGHEWGEVTYTWNKDNTACTAKRVCKNDPSHVEEVKATVTSKQTKAPTYEAEGEMTYTAKFAEAWAEEQVKTETIDKLTDPVVPDSPSDPTTPDKSEQPEDATKPDNTPQTGDSGHLMVWAMFAILSLTGATFVVTSKKRKKAK